MLANKNVICSNLWFIPTIRVTSPLQEEKEGGIISYHRESRIFKVFLRVKEPLQKFSQLTVMMLRLCSALVTSALSCVLMVRSSSTSKADFCFSRLNSFCKRVSSWAESLWTSLEFSMGLWTRVWKRRWGKRDRERQGGERRERKRERGERGREKDREKKREWVREREREREREKLHVHYYCFVYSIFLSVLSLLITNYKVQSSTQNVRLSADGTW